MHSRFSCRNIRIQGNAPTSAAPFLMPELAADGGSTPSADEFNPQKKTRICRPNRFKMAEIQLGIPVSELNVEQASAAVETTDKHSNDG